MRALEGRGAALPLLAIALVVIVIVAIASMVLLIPWRSTSVNEARSADVTSEMREVDVSVEQAMGSVEIHFSSETQDAVTMTIRGTVKHNLLSSGNALEISWSHEVAGERLIVDAKVDADAYSSTFGSDDLVTVITIPSHLSTSVNATGAVGSVEFVAGEGIALRGGHLAESTGSILAQLSGCSLTGELTLQTSTGSSTLEWSEVTIPGSAQVRISSSTGGTMMEVQQTVALGGNLSLDASSNAGSLSLDLSIEGGNSARVTSAANLGDVSIGKKVGFTGATNEDIQSVNYPSQYNMDLAMEANLGGISMNLEYKA
ncbi:MAG TPA: hypothetical protein VLU38_00075 [Methanomassiliicoccales archaeon]|nr:hypothetical protein [Methanomassiliicoccales archaeon]